ncbi:copper amine oxidase N-terminal domain-containing protein [Aneurinibacillus terranovensis]|uniref:copper amine oxidase N-terminal domain-containing protein n=1 Tax=Aneurinibacillus terranovensis TaxID=278991 RepID=UPI0003FF6865|nr:copper amine oxidase N-terminal domain-containing protein [Aneurinibacillus terranovensis]
MNKKIVAALLSASLVLGATPVFAHSEKEQEKEHKNDSTYVFAKVKVNKDHGLENALKHVKNEKARQAILRNIMKQQGEVTTTDDDIQVTPPTTTTDDSIQVISPVTTGDTINVNPVSVNISINITINGSKLALDQAPVITGGRTEVPMRSIFEALGAKIDWDAKTNTVVAVKGNKVVAFKVGSDIATVNGKKVKLEQKSRILNKRTMVPLRFVSESLGARVDWNGATRTIGIFTQK